MQVKKNTITLHKGKLTKIFPLEEDLDFISYNGVFDNAVTL